MESPTLHPELAEALLDLAVARLPLRTRWRRKNPALQRWDRDPGEVVGQSNDRRLRRCASGSRSLQNLGTDHAERYGRAAQDATNQRTVDVWVHDRRRYVCAARGTPGDARVTI